ncbi:CGNR zinc finger domain-containing protein [Microbacterium sp. zg.B96]|uniref:CGNR zinc finger domain-containing protein n=1 Tax=Microbacterium sp. zg.B96 TaxID=2969409 RepID=UPI0035A95F41
MVLHPSGDARWYRRVCRVNRRPLDRAGSRRSGLCVAEILARRNRRLTAGDECDNVVVDVTRNGRQRYCSVRCANRDGVRRHRARNALLPA